MLRINKNYITFLLPPGEKHALRVAAAEDGYQGMSPLVREIVRAYLKMRSEEATTFERALALVRDEVGEK